ncbi:unnamed protein product [Psylliodes chrysocephalus]|uniref:DNA-directed DNA polymerase n=1 Tax=Psylliodes chrysocephalus TaxID=3402493 RepID=A0A9P0CWH6_9CUCU|nr:unnamed protein product [Psylliodes chrysocephala]
MSIFNNLVRYIASFLGLLNSRYDEEIAGKGIRDCQKGIWRIKSAMKTVKTIGEKQHLQACLNNIKTLRTQIKAMEKKGAGLKSQPERAWNRVHWNESESAFESRIISGVITNLKHKDPKAFLIDAKAIFKHRIQTVLRKDAAVKINTVFAGEFEIVKGDSVLNKNKYFTTSNSPIYRDTNLDVWFDMKVINPIIIELEEFQERDSGWALKKIMNLGVNINKFTPQLGSAYIDLPPQIKNKNACINVKNDDDACFAWAVISALYPAIKHADRTTSYPHYTNILKLKGIQFPMTVKQIPNFEKQNNLFINFTFFKKIKSIITLPNYLTKNKTDRHINLLLIQDRYDDAPSTYHYVWIKSLSRLLLKQLSKENGQSILRPTNDPRKPQHHVPAAVGYYIKCIYDNSLSFYKSYSGQDCMAWFADEMSSLAEDLATLFWCIDMTFTQEMSFRKATCCHICEQAFTAEDKKVRDHNHVISKNNFRGAAHESCFTWDAMLKHTKQELELLTDLDMFLFVEKGIREGLSQVCSKRRAHANMYINNYDPSKPKTFLMYYDVNIQYGWAMSQYLPYGSFE